MHFAKPRRSLAEFMHKSIVFFVVHVQCCRKESSHLLSHLLMSLCILVYL